MDRDAQKRDAQKIAAAQAALDAIRPLVVRDAVLGIGTGSTANHFIDALAGLKGHFDATVASSEATAARLRGHGIRVVDLNAAPALAVYVDGADEADPHRRLIKGAGGALTREKIVAASADRFVCIADETKRVARLGALFPVPVEVVTMARGLVARALVELGGQPELRHGYVTDNGQCILDVHGLDLADPEGMERTIKGLTGVLEVGLFAIRPADVLIIAGAGGVTTH